jgi:predicted molibdopterin-dependent oxidoreductase YjgC
MTRHHTPERSLPTFCRICEAACGLLVDIDASGHPVRLRPDRQHPVSQGFACAKGTRFLEVAKHPERLLFPRRRADGGYERHLGEAMAFLAQRRGLFSSVTGPMLWASISGIRWRLIPWGC